MKRRMVFEIRPGLAKNAAPEIGRPGGFSVVELLLAAGVIAILLALMLPMAGAMRRKALAVGCLSNLRTIGTAIMAYSVENRGRMPGPSFEMVELAKAHAISGKLKDYLEPKVVDAVWECPANPALIARNRIAARSNSTRYAAYTTHTPYFGYTYTPPKVSPEPMLLSQLKELPRPQQWLLRDVDYWSYPSVARIGGDYPPVHAGGRHHLYPDITVEWHAVEPK